MNTAIDEIQVQNIDHLGIVEAKKVEAKKDDCEQDLFGIIHYVFERCKENLSITLQSIILQSN